MTFTHPELNLTDPTQGFAHFVLYTEPHLSVAGAAWNATIIIERQSSYVREWLDRIQRCDPNPLHTTLVDNHKIPRLFHPCVDEDADSPSAVAGSGCTCCRTWYDPASGLPVVGEHFRTRGGDTDRWTYTTYAPLDLRPGDTFHAVIIDRASRLFWIRTGAGSLSFVPEHLSRGYDVGRSGGGPDAFAQYLSQLVASGGQDTAVAIPASEQSIDPQLRAWVTSQDAARTQELTLRDLNAIRQR
ncbi:hypothetical protein GCM10010411_74540 [Actinomadura fulvescens]|uniref:Uncharacterized protein n=1 Tax=Actinomadura fulvescens TaxID=46160 RepID=A0ABP6CXF3_9ACTN